MRFLGAIFLSTFSLLGQAQTPPGSDIYIGAIERGENGLTINGLTKVTDNPEYSNQPYFFSEKTLYFTQEIDGQMDTMRYSIQDKSVKNITQSSESEYSPTPTPDGEGFSVIKVNAEGKQELWQIGFNGLPMKHLSPAIEPVGYHVWTMQDKVLLFVLGEPHKLKLADPFIETDEGVSIASSIGASLFAMPNTFGYTYSVHEEDKAPELWWYSPSTQTQKRIGQLPKGANYYAWGPTSELFTTDNGQLVSMPFIVDREEIVFTAFKPVVIKSEYCQSGVSRIAISPYEEQIALVCNRP
ncbi:TolB family protein [Glaciecola sp. 1036]|uniref:TolB family protein n=1 Tax=Alteromonadaceae TaxID=72275 RepID=UPI003D04A5BA